MNGTGKNTEDDQEGDILDDLPVTRIFIDDELHKNMREFWDSLSQKDKVRLFSSNLDRALIHLSSGMTHMDSVYAKTKEKQRSKMEEQLLSKMFFMNENLTQLNGMFSAC